MAAQKLTAEQRRDRRAKIMLAVLGVVLLAVVGLQAPKLMGSAGGGAATPPPATTSAAGLASVSLAPPTAASQLRHFTQFKPKDPFKAGVSAAAAGQSSSQGTPTTTQDTTTTTDAGTTTPAGKQKPPLTLTMSQTPTVPAGPRVPAAMIMVNGKRQIIPLDMPFPAKHPLFTLSAVGDKTVWLKLIGGSLANGTQTIKLTRGRKITLVNATMNVRFVLALVKPTTAPKPTILAPTTTATTTTPAATTSTQTTTTTG